jgi:hypothetical protein
MDLEEAVLLALRGRWVRVLDRRDIYVPGDIGILLRRDQDRSIVRFGKFQQVLQNSHIEVL